MTGEEKYIYWKVYAERDLDAAKAMFETGRWFYVTFMCQQAVEKLIKGLYTFYVDDNVPRTHNIESLINCFQDLLPVSIDETYHQLFEILSAHYISNRYPDFISVEGSKINAEYAKNILVKTEEVFEWLLTLKLQKK